MESSTYFWTEEVLVEKLACLGKNSSKQASLSVDTVRADFSDLSKKYSTYTVGTKSIVNYHIKLTVAIREVVATFLGIFIHNSVKVLLLISILSYI